MAKKKQVYFNKVTQQGQEDNMCPECDGDGVFVGDYEDDCKSIDLTVCYLCNATGVAEYGKDYDIKVNYYEDEPIFEVIPISK